MTTLDPFGLKFYTEDTRQLARVVELAMQGWAGSPPLASGYSIDSECLLIHDYNHKNPFPTDLGPDAVSALVLSFLKDRSPSGVEYDGDGTTEVGWMLSTDPKDLLDDYTGYGAIFGVKPVWIYYSK